MKPNSYVTLRKVMDFLTFSDEDKIFLAHVLDKSAASTQSTVVSHHLRVTFQRGRALLCG